MHANKKKGQKGYHVFCHPHFYLDNENTAVASILQGLRNINNIRKTIKSVDPDDRGDNHGPSDRDFLLLTSKQADNHLIKQVRDGILDTELEAEEVTMIFSQGRWSDYKITPLYKIFQNTGLISNKQKPLAVLFARV
jgi:hypothetical protein